MSATDTILQEYQLLIEQHSSALMRLSRGYERNVERSQDLYQEILLAIWRARPAFKRQCSERTWMYRIAHNTAITFSSRSSRDRLQRAVSLEELELPIETPTGEDQVATTQLLEILDGILEALKPIDRELVLLYLEDVPQKEISEITGLTQDNVSTRLSRLRQVLKARAMESVHHDKRSG